ncbi:MAG: CoA-binding protein [Desulfurococcaceae archaeon]
MSSNPLRTFFYPESIAIIGASRNPLKIGGILTKNIIEGGYKGKVYLVNPSGESIFGFKAYKSILDVKDNVDLAIIVIPAKSVPIALRELGEKGIKAVVVISSGFAEAGNEGRALQEEVVKIARQYGIRMIGPNSFGIVSSHINLNATFGVPLKTKGSIAVLSQSGAIADGILDWFQDEGLAFSILVNLGNRGDVSESEILEFLLEDENTEAIGIYLEGLPPGGGKKFMDTLSAVSRVKPVVILKAGKSTAGAKAALSHTGSLAGNYRVYESAIRQRGGIFVEDMEGFMDTLRAYSGYIKRLKYSKIKCQHVSCSRSASTKKIAIISNSGGLGILASDEAEKIGLEVPTLPSNVVNDIRKIIPPFGNPYNPIDITAQGTPQDQYSMYTKVFEVIEKAQLVDGYVLVIEGSYPPELMGVLKDAVVNDILQKTPKPVVVNWFAAKSAVASYIFEIEKSGIPVYPTPERAVRSIHKLLTHSVVLE